MNHLKTAITFFIDLGRPQSTVDVNPVVLTGVQQPTCLLDHTQTDRHRVRPQSTVDVNPVVLTGVQQPTCLLDHTNTHT